MNNGGDLTIHQKNILKKHIDRYHIYGVIDRIAKDQTVVHVSKGESYSNAIHPSIFQ